MGGSSSSSAQTTTQNDFQFQNTDSRGLQEVNGDAVLGGNVNLTIVDSQLGNSKSSSDSGEGSSPGGASAAGTASIKIQQTDLGAIAKAFGFGEQALNLTGETVAASLDAVLDANETAGEQSALLVNRGLEFATKNIRSENQVFVEQFTKLALGLGGVAAVALVIGARK